MPVSRRARRNLTLIAKVLQNLVNQCPFGEKELHMEPFNRFILESQPKLQRYLLSLANTGEILDYYHDAYQFKEYAEDSSEFVSLNARELAALHRILIEYQDDFIVPCSDDTHISDDDNDDEYNQKQLQSNKSTSANHMRARSVSTSMDRHLHRHADPLANVLTKLGSEVAVVTNNQPDYSFMFHLQVPSSELTTPPSILPTPVDRMQTSAASSSTATLTKSGVQPQNLSRTSSTASSVLGISSATHHQINANSLGNVAQLRGLSEQDMEHLHHRLRTVLNQSIISPNQVSFFSLKNNLREVLLAVDVLCFDSVHMNDILDKLASVAKTSTFLFQQQKVLKLIKKVRNRLQSTVVNDQVYLASPRGDPQSSNVNEDGRQLIHKLIEDFKLRKVRWEDVAAMHHAISDQCEQEQRTLIVMQNSRHQYEDYLKNSELKAFISNLHGSQNAQIVGPFCFKVQELEGMGLLASIDIMASERRATRIKFSSASPGYASITLQIPPLPGTNQSRFSIHELRVTDLLDLIDTDTSEEETIQYG
eukprot:CAMPEP_0201556006 /NCGR_PEP_ID=MMETSP0173_2-20130828/52632_1 /ASSEMBLY_ACC=CAM_ASM_000268 /TAXON_ID=218659 /ORGANISM="Vexillifera sp., Strain DIVA3 564/2" /LENGTH=535 /DNA_ID=CAMNT_0047968057 /DNA_START=201 /DNA_END=1804 /DNA_ORIENTATION=-